jgi:hypothetical protein
MNYESAILNFLDIFLFCHLIFHGKSLQVFLRQYIPNIIFLNDSKFAFVFSVNHSLIVNTQINAFDLNIYIFFYIRVQKYKKIYNNDYNFKV